MKLHWPLEFDGIGRNLGYAEASRQLRAALQRNGVVFDQASEIVCMFAPAHILDRRDPDRFVCLFTMYEADRLPETFMAGLRLADLIVAPSRYNRRIMKRHGFEAELCPLGFDPTRHPYLERTPPAGENFRFLWVGAPDIRKAWDLVIEAFQREFTPHEPVELYVKTTGTRHPLHLHHHKVHFDGRKVTPESMRRLYESAHAFVFPSRGEGFGLPPLEAMASGALVIAPSHTGLAEFVRRDTALVVETGVVHGRYGVDVKVPEPRIKHLRRLMRYAYEDFDATRMLRRNAARFVHGRFTWGHQAQPILHIFRTNKDPGGHHHIGRATL